MFYISSKSDYAMAFLLHLAKHPNDFVSLNAFCKQQGLPQQYLAQIVPKLNKMGIIQSKEGKHGGHKLLKSPNEIFVLEILECMEGKISLVKCLSEKENLKTLSCEKNCKTKNLWKWMAEDLRNYFSKINLTDLIEKKL